jgi:hypothetical protein
MRFVSKAFLSKAGMKRWLCSGLAGALLFLPAGMAAQTARVLFVQSLKSQPGLESFQGRWESQQGLVFISKDALALYQLQFGPKGAAKKFQLSIVVLDAHNGRRLGSLQIPAAPGPVSVMAGSQGTFLVRTGDVLSLYSGTFERFAFVALPAFAKDQNYDWQVDVSPNGRAVVVVGQKTSSGEAEVNILDGSNLQSWAKFKVSHLDRWSASDKFLIAADPEQAPGEGEMGVMDFEGHWRRLSTQAESEDPDCPYNMVALEKGLIAGFNCDELAVVSEAGNPIYAGTIPDGQRIAGIASDRLFLAQVIVRKFFKTPIILVHDIERKRIRFHAFVEKPSFAYSVSPEGLLATVDGDEIKVFDAPATAARIPK